MNAPITVQPRKARDYASEEDVRWCPGCGDYAILKAVQKTLAERGADPDNTVFVSGIGCSSRFPFYMNTYGFHTIHGRAPAVATGVKLANPGLDVWVVTGDGDALSIGGNHLLHVLRRNVDLNLLLFNNEVYGLTKGQVSPTSPLGMASPSTPRGSLDGPANAAAFALGAGARFVARAIDTQAARLGAVLHRAADFRGTALVEILQNCIVYHDGAFAGLTDRAAAAANQLHVEHGRPLRYGQDDRFGLRLNLRSLQLEAVTVGEDGIDEGDIVVHDATNPTLAGMLARLAPPLPTALGVLYCAPDVTFEERVAADRSGRTAPDAGSINALLRKGGVWRSAAQPARGA